MADTSKYLRSSRIENNLKIKEGLYNLKGKLSARGGTRSKGDDKKYKELLNRLNKSNADLKKLTDKYSELSEGKKKSDASLSDFTDNYRNYVANNEEKDKKKNEKLDAITNYLNKTAAKKAEGNQRGGARENTATPKETAPSDTKNEVVGADEETEEGGTDSSYYDKVMGLFDDILTEGNTEEESDKSSEDEAEEEVSTDAERDVTEKIKYINSEDVYAGRVKNAVRNGEVFTVNEQGDQVRITNRHDLRTKERGNYVNADRDGSRAGGTNYVLMDKDGKRLNYGVYPASGKIISIRGSKNFNDKAVSTSRGKSGGVYADIMMPDGNVTRIMHLPHEMLQNKDKYINSVVKAGQRFDFQGESGTRKGTGLAHGKAYVWKPKDSVSALNGIVPNNIRYTIGTLFSKFDKVK